MLVAPIVTRAQEGTPDAVPSSFPANCTVIASGLYNPRDVALGNDGTVYIAEAGDGGPEAVYLPVGEGTPAATEVLTMVGDTGQITKVAPDGTQSVLATGLPSYTFGTEIVGPSGVTVVDGKIYATVGGPGVGLPLVPQRPNLDSVIAVDAASGAVTTLANIGAYELSDNPDPNAIDSNLGGLAAGSDGMLYVADSGGNAIYKVDPTSGEFSVFSVIPGLDAPGVQNPERGGRAENDPVPTDVAPAPDGGVYVSLLTGAIGWGTPGGAKVIHIAPDGSITDAVTGLNLAVSVTVDADGALTVSQLSENIFGQPPAPGAVVRSAQGGAPESLAADLPMPYGVAVDGDGNLYVAVNASAPMGTPAAGQVLRCAPEAAVQTPTFTIEAVDIKFVEKSVTIPANQDVTLVITNNGVAPHDFSIDELNIHTGAILGGESKTVTINSAPASYTFYCGIPGHRQAGMVGTLTVQ